MEISRLGPEDTDRVLAAASLFDEPPHRARTLRFLTADGHHLLLAAVDGLDVGFVSGVEIAHPDKDVEMLLYELGVTETHRRRGIGRALVGALRAVAVEQGCRGMWVPTQPDDVAAVGTYRSAGAAPPEPAAILTWTLPVPADG